MYTSMYVNVYIISTLVWMYERDDKTRYNNKNKKNENNHITDAN